MKRVLAVVGVAFAALVAMAAAAATVIVNGWHIEKADHTTLASRLEPDLEIHLPEGDGPFPVIVSFHGCLGIMEGNRIWADSLASLGYATVLVNSLAFREVEPMNVCSGFALWGSERAADVVAAVDHVRRLPQVASERIALVGWSHGAWSIMDALALDPPRRLPTGLRTSPGRPFDGVRAIALFYPYCSWPAESRSADWTLRIPTLLQVVRGDSVTPEGDCLETADRLAAAGAPIETYVYQGVRHGFTEVGNDGWDPVQSAVAFDRMIDHLDRELQSRVEQLQPSSKLTE